MSLPAEERRALVRYPSSQEACLLDPSMRGILLAAKVRDISTQGIGLLVGKQLISGAQVTIDIQDRNRGESRILQARVVHATLQPEGRWLVGCVFSTSLSAEELREIL